MISKIYKKFFVTFFWMVIRLVFKTRHKYKYVGLQNVPKSGSVLLLGNHVSWIDWIILQLSQERHINFLMDKNIYEWKFFNHVFKNGDVIPLSSRASKDAFKEASKRLQDGKIVAIYPEGTITRDGKLGKFYRGYEKIPQDYEGMIVPFYIDSAVFGSIFSRVGSKGRNLFKRREITVYFDTPVPSDTKAEKLREIVMNIKERNEAK